MKKTLLFKQIRQEIISGKWQEGTKLPTEFEYANLLNVSRKTIRNAFQMLEEEGYIERVKAKGTFVRLPKVDENSRIIYMLVPCEEYLRLSGVYFQQLLFALIAETAKVEWGIVPVIFSKTNSNQDIWWENLARFNSNSRIIIHRSWFSTYFEALASIDARVAYIDDDIAAQGEMRHCTSKWLNFLEDNRLAAQNAIRYLIQRGCRSIGMFLPRATHPQSSISLGYSDALQEAKLPEYMLEYEDAITALESMRDFQEKNSLDGLIIHISENTLPIHRTLREALGVSANVPIVAIPKIQELLYSDPKEDIAVLRYPIQTMVHDIVEQLIAPNYIPNTYHYLPYLTQGGNYCSRQDQHEL